MPRETLIGLSSASEDEMTRFIISLSHFYDLGPLILTSHVHTDMISLAVKTDLLWTAGRAK